MKNDPTRFSATDADIKFYSNVKLSSPAIDALEQDLEIETVRALETDDWTGFFKISERIAILRRGLWGAVA